MSILTWVHEYLTVTATALQTEWKQICYLQAGERMVTVTVNCDGDGDGVVETRF